MAYLFTVVWKTYQEKSPNWVGLVGALAGLEGLPPGMIINGYCQPTTVVIWEEDDVSLSNSWPRSSNLLPR